MRDFFKKHRNMLLLGYALMLGLLLIGMPRETRAAVASPEAPQVVGSANGRVVKLTWKKPARAEGYQVLLYNASSKTYRWYHTYQTTSSTISVQYKGNENTEYKYRIYAFRTVNKQRYFSNGTNVTVRTVPAPETVITSAKVNSKGNAEIKWDINRFSNGYKVYRSESANTGFKQIKLITSRYTGSYEDTTIKPNKVYYYRVRAFCRNTNDAVYGAYGNTRKLILAGQTEKKNYVFVGDSRTVYLQYWNSSAKDTTWICKSSMGYDWLSKTADAKILSSIKEGTELFIWLGVNDPYNINNYIKYYNSRITKWKSMGATVHMVAVGQVQNDPYVTNSEIVTFNRKLKSGVTGVKYIDLYTYLGKVGYSTLDGTHYDENTNRKIYKYLKQQVG